MMVDGGWIAWRMTDGVKEKEVFYCFKSRQCVKCMIREVSQQSFTLNMELNAVIVIRFVLNLLFMCMGFVFPINQKILRGKF